jgi:hypothetical protein
VYCNTAEHNKADAEAVRQLKAQNALGDTSKLSRLEMRYT